MKFNIIKNKITILLACFLSSAAIYAMEPERTNSVTPYVHAAASLAVARYVPEVVEPLMPRIVPDYPLAHAFVPPIIRYGAYGLGAHFILKNGLGINYTDLIKADYMKKAALNTAKASPNFVPALLCHPQVAQIAADYCSHAASPYLNDAQLQVLERYAAPAIMATGLVTTAYLLNRNVLNNQVLQKAKRIWKDIRPYSFIAPALASYNADAVKEYVMPYVSTSLGKNLSSDVGSGVKAGVYWGGAGLAAYLFATQTLDLANRGYVKKHINKLLDICSQLKDRITSVAGSINHAQAKTNQIRAAQTQDANALADFSKQTAETMTVLSDILKEVASKNTIAETAVKALENHNANLITKAKNIGTIAAEIAQDLRILKEEHTKKIQQFRATMKDTSEQVLKVIAQKNKDVESRMNEIETACINQTNELTQLQPKLAELLQLLHQEGQTYHIDQQMIVSIVQTLENSSLQIDQMTEALATMHKALQTPGK